ncbi:hypothetical protein IscW_ISCW014046 [Ixodes scapularis]|uniref:Uncharacterized protein n=1 Tax=Ixodes scapularis TaxID=6945 RepID=B7QMJ7_IXOSC|nr:hypothetical protein IscW_ISCW014046 [Ixodes scapularis]|eukprot:XP_002416402.1 hypothetical protein IscW_ISCW014046 [Ixodes scapularis]
MVTSPGRKCGAFCKALFFVRRWSGGVRDLSPGQGPSEIPYPRYNPRKDGGSRDVHSVRKVDSDWFGRLSAGPTGIRFLRGGILLSTP